MSARPSCSIYFENTHHYHKVDARLFELSDLRAANVRDQIVRATYLTYSVIREGLVTAERPLLVFGGGAAGVSCAVAALNLGLSVFLVEKEDHLFVTQMSTNTRTIDPGEFDWPLPHWNSGVVPPDAGKAFALAYRRGVASDVATAWTMLCDEYEDEFGDRFVVVPGVDARELELQVAADGVTVKGLEGARLPPPSFGAVISCVGFGEEVVFDKQARWNYRGLKFWADDTLHAEKLGIGRHRSGEIHALVSGGGDGAQQDVQRILTRTFGFDLVVRLQAWPDVDARFAAQFASIGDRCLAIDDLVWDSVDWQHHNAPDPTKLQAWHDAYEDVVDSVWSSLSEQELDWQTQNVIRPEVRSLDLALTWVLRDPYPSICYPLNRFLTAWVLRLYARISSRELCARGGSKAAMDCIMVTGYEITKIASGAASHVCSDRAACFAQAHHVWVAPSDGSRKASLLGEFHEIVLRHGIDRTPLFDRSAPPLMLKSTDMVRPGLPLRRY
ncbi:hypothetical protein GCM10007320_66500 [Pseudorhodoferax aquiterrae]|uniref:FAD-dependent oxidoreductase n=1 Tax=Pseudorhodoferax aquiterrae TaxID=747304 RepID=A0ABQ3GG45_9BURK|nr:FAD/NAD(P)-binding protein [Pseudorhodoferax aquiterrae]GHD05000.1 hypothetical protein GCM10007320_66500 [Pseudorhodoferax aquiterrae]